MENRHEPLTESCYYILLCLSQGDSYGYKIMSRAKILSGGLVTIGPGTMYGALNSMIQKGWICEAGQEGKRRIYRLTTQGGDVLDKEIQRLERMVASARAAFSQKEKEQS